LFAADQPIIILANFYSLVSCKRKVFFNKMSVQNDRNLFVFVLDERIIQLLDHGISEVWMMPRGDPSSIYQHMSNILGISIDDFELGLNHSPLVKSDGQFKYDQWATSFKCLEVKWYDFRP